MPTTAPCLVAVVASAGGVEALVRLLSSLPSDLDATVLVQLHVSAGSSSLLAQVLSRRSTLPVVAAEDGMPLKPATVVVAVPDRHLLVARGAVVLEDSPPERGHRPSHDLLLGSVAVSVGPRATGVVLSGLLSDGAEGLRQVRRHGGACLVQDDAEFPDMPRNALRAVPDAEAFPLDQLPQEIVRAVRDCVHTGG
jgi:two-component system chemotaxis response regulator CheB